MPNASIAFGQRPAHAQREERRTDDREIDGSGDESTTERGGGERRR